MPVYWPGGVRHVGDVSPIYAAFVRNGRERAPILSPEVGGERECLERAKP